MMRFVPKNLFIQNLDAQTMRENFLLSSVITVFVIRFFLRITDYPQLSGAGLHIAHLLWGGLFMLVALLLIFSFLSKGALHTTSILGGIGFGAFVDELGKFITSDNNYFFQPTVAILYVLFITLYILSRLLSQKQIITREEYLANAVDMIKEAVINDLDEIEKKRALLYLSKSNPQDPLVKLLTSYLHEIQVVPSNPSLLSQFRGMVLSWYQKVTQSELFVRSVIVILLAQTLLTLFSASLILIVRPTLTFAEQGQLFSSLLSGGFVLVGALYFQKNKVKAYRFFRTSVYIAIFLTQFFYFYQEQFFALIGLGINVVLLSIIEYALSDEKK